MMKSVTQTESQGPGLSGTSFSDPTDSCGTSIMSGKKVMLTVISLQVTFFPNSLCECEDSWQSSVISWQGHLLIFFLFPSQTIGPALFTAQQMTKFALGVNYKDLHIILATCSPLKILYSHGIVKEIRDSFTLLAQPPPFLKNYVPCSLHIWQTYTVFSWWPVSFQIQHALLGETSSQCK